MKYFLEKYYTTKNTRQQGTYANVASVPVPEDGDFIAILSPTSRTLLDLQVRLVAQLSIRFESLALNLMCGTIPSSTAQLPLSPAFGPGQWYDLVMSIEGFSLIVDGDICSFFETFTLCFKWRVFAEVSLAKPHFGDLSHIS